MLLCLVGLGDAAVNWYPLALSSPEWEFGTIGASFGALPLITMGLAALVGSFTARGVRWGMVMMATVLLVFGLLVAGVFLVFLTDVPLALRATAHTAASIAIRRGIARATVLGVGFSAGYLAAAVMTFRFLRGGARA